MVKHYENIRKRLNSLAWDIKMLSKDIPKIVSIVHQNEIETICKELPKEGNLQYFVCYVIFNNGQAFVLSNMFHMLISREFKYEVQFPFFDRIY